MRQYILYILILFSTHAYSQNDTLYLNKANIILNGVKYNCLNRDNERTGNWIVYGLKDEVSIMTTGSGYDSVSMVDVHTYIDVVVRYRALNELEKEGERIVLKEKLDTSFNDKRYYITIEEIYNKIPPDKYYIVGKGKYERGHKTGVWIYYYESGKIWKEIEYKDD